MSWGETLFLKNFIKGEKTFCVSDAVIAISWDNSGKYSFVPKLDGVVRFKSNVRKVSNNYRSIRMEVFENGTLKATSFESGDLQYLEEKEIYVDVSVKSGKTYTSNLALSSDGTGYYGNDGIKVCGQVTDYNYFETAVIE